MTTMPMDLKNFNLTCETDIPVRLSFDQVLQLYHFKDEKIRSVVYFHKDLWICGKQHDS
jgi:hypothetical protein